MSPQSQKFKWTLACLGAAILAACAQTPDTGSTAERLTVKGKLDIPVVEGSAITDNCMTDLLEIDKKYQTVCVIVPFTGDENDMVNVTDKYMTALDENGWIMSGGEGNGYYLKKQTADNCQLSMTYAGFPFSTLDDMEKRKSTHDYNDINDIMLLFVIDDKLICGKGYSAK